MQSFDPVSYCFSQISSIKLNTLHYYYNLYAANSFQDLNHYLTSWAAIKQNSDH
jgi:hypothetical protein